MLGLAVGWRADREAPLTPEVARYVEGFGGAGDAGLVAVRGGVEVRAAWWRRFSAARPGYGFVAEDVPELSLAVVPEARGDGRPTRRAPGRRHERREGEDPFGEVRREHLGDHAAERRADDVRGVDVEVDEEAGGVSGHVAQRGGAIRRAERLEAQLHLVADAGEALAGAWGGRHAKTVPLAGRVPRSARRWAPPP